MHAKSTKLENALPLLISAKKWEGSVFTAGLTFNFTQLKFKKVTMPHRVNFLS